MIPFRPDFRTATDKEVTDARERGTLLGADETHLYYEMGSNLVVIPRKPLVRVGGTKVRHHEHS